MVQKKLRFVIGSLEVGGAEMHLSQILPQLKERGWEIELVVLSDRLALRQDFDQADIPIIHSRTVRFHKYPTLLRRLLVAYCNARLLWQVFRKDSRAVTHFFLPEAYLMGMLVAQLCRYPAPLLMSRRCLNVYQKRRPWIARLEHYFHRRCASIFCNSKAIQAELISEEGVPTDKVQLIYNGVSSQRIETPSKEVCRRDLGLNSEALILVSVANLHPYKGHGDLIQALGSMRRDLPADWKLLLLGRDVGEYKASLMQSIHQAELQENIVFIEDCQNPAPYLKAADIGLLVSHQEGFSNAILEMMAAALPIIATNVGGNPEAVSHQHNGLIVEPHCPENIAKALHRLMCAPDAPEYRTTLGQHSAQRFHAHFSLKQCIDAYEEIYKRIIESYSF